MTEKEQRLLDQVKRHNDNYRSGFTISGGGGKGANFMRISLEKRMAKLAAAGLVEKGAHNGWWAITPVQSDQAP